MSLEQVRERVKEWTRPISEETPAGRAPKGDAAFDAVQAEIAKLESLTGPQVDWASVVQGGAKILKGTSKDLRVASWLAHGLYQTQGLGGLTAGIELLADTIDGFWPGLFPELVRIRGRASALTWFVDKTCLTLPNLRPSENDRAIVEALEAATKRLAEVTRQKFEANAPAMSPLLEASARLKATLPEKKAPPPPSPSNGAPAAAPQTPAPAPSSVAPAPAAATSALPASAEAASDFLAKVGAGLASTAALLRRAHSADPAPYRLVRVGIWLHLAQPPPSNANRTAIPPPPPALRTQLEKMIENAKWAEVVDEAESALATQRFWLDLHRFTHRALRELGEGHARARTALVTELGSALRRFDGVLQLTFNDGTPLADAQTASWISDEVLAGPAGGNRGNAPGAARDEQGKLDAEVRALVGAGKVAEAIARLDAARAGSSEGRARFLTRVQLAQICLGSGHAAVGRALFEELDREIVEHRLDTWEPALAARCLEAILAATRPAPKGPEPLIAAWNQRYARLCLIDATAALRIAPAS